MSLSRGYAGHEHEHASTTDLDAEAPGRHSATEALNGGQGVLPSGLIMRKATRDDAGVAPGAEVALAATNGASGTVLPAELRGKFERSLGADLSGVRIHTSATSATAAQAVGAKAYAVGQDIHFGPGQFDPSSTEGERLLAHEVAHTVQQQGAAASPQFKLEVSNGTDHAEVEADAAADAMLTGQAFTMSRAPVTIARQKDPDAAEPPAVDPVKELAAHQAKCIAGKPPLVTKAAGKAAAIKAAVDRADTAAMTSAANAVADAISAAEAITKAAHRELDHSDEDTMVTPAWDSANAACGLLDVEINNQATGVLNALTLAIPTATVGAPGGGESLAGDIRARVKVLAPRLDGAAQLRASAQAAGGKHAKARLDAAQPVRDKLGTLVPAERAYVIGVMKTAGVPADILDFFDGTGAELRKSAGDLGAAGGNNAVEANKQGAPAFKPADIPDKNKTSVRADGATGDLGAGKELNAGRSGDGQRTGKATLGGGADMRADDGTTRFEGAKFEAGYAMPGQPSVKVSGLYSQITTPPVYDGTRWIVAYTITKSGSAGTGRATDPRPPNTALNGGAAASGATASADVKLSGALVKGGSKVFADQAAAAAYYTSGNAEILDPKLLEHALPDAKQIGSMKEGETFTLGSSADLGAGITGTQAGVSVGVSGSAGSGQEAKLTKKDGEKLQVTFRAIEQKGGSGSVGTTGLSGSAGGGVAHAISVTAEFDLATAEGKAAYTKWSAKPDVAPTPGAGVKIISRGSGDFASKNVGIGVGAAVVNGTASNTSTTGEFTEKTEDGKHSQTTVVGTQTDAVKGFNPVTPDKQTRTDSLEIVTNDGDAKTATFTTKTSIQAQGDAKAANAELGKVLGESSSAGQSLDGEKSSGTTGKWSVDGSYSKAQMDDFQAKVASGKFNPSRRATDVGDPGADLKAVLANPKATDAEKQKAMAKWYAERGPDASKDLREAIGPPKLAVTLDGDKYMTGAAGQAIFDGKLAALEARMGDAKLAGDAIKTLLRDVVALYAEMLEKRDHIANPAHYPELPNGLRHELVKQVQGNYGAVQQLRNRVAAKAKAEGLGDVGSNAELNKRMTEVNRRRELAATARSQALDRRRKHTGALSAGIDSPRGELERNKLPNQAETAIRGHYKDADAAWAEGLAKMTEAEERERAMYKEDCLAAASQDLAVKAADQAIAAYEVATRGFTRARLSLDMIYLKSKTSLAKEWAGYDKQNYGTLD